MGPVASTYPSIRLSKSHWEAMKTEVQAHAPEEACGIVAGVRGQSLAVFPVENQLHSPSRFRMDPHQQIHVFLLLEERGWDLLAIYHSHPQGPETPSPTDITEAYYPEAVHLIWYPNGPEWGCRGYLIVDQDVEEVPIYLSNESP